jgi:hypothetical protein
VGKAIQTKQKKGEKGQVKRKKLKNKTIKEEPKIKVLPNELLISTLLSNAISLMILQSYKSLFTDSSHIKFGLPLPFFLLPVCLITPLQTGASAGLQWICPNHLKRCYTSFFSTGTTSNLSCMSSF